MLVFPEQPVHLTAEQVGELNRQLCAVRLDINHYLALIRTLLAQQSIQTGEAAEKPFAGPSGDRVPPHQATTLTASQIRGLYEGLATARHDINGQGMLIIAVFELMRLKPQDEDRLLNKLVTVPATIKEKMDMFCAAFEQAFGAKGSPGLPEQAFGIGGGREESGAGLGEASGSVLVSILVEQPSKIRESVKDFSDQFEKMVGIIRPPSPLLPRTASRAC